MPGSTQAFALCGIAAPVFYVLGSGLVQIVAGTAALFVLASPLCRLGPGHVWLAATYSLLGREEEARIEAKEVLRINPKFSLERFAKRADPELVSALRKAGLK